MRKVRVHIAWMDCPVRPDEVEQRPHVPSASRTPRHWPAARMHQRLQRAGDEAVVDEDVFVNVEALVATFEIAGAIARDAVAERQILSPGWRANRIRLDKRERIECALERGRRKQTARDGESAQFVEGHADERYLAALIDCT